MLKEKDILEKSLEEYNDVFADIINVLLYDGEEVVQPTDLTDAQPFSLYYDGDNQHEQIRDIAKYWEDPEEGPTGFQMIMFGIENQTVYDPDMPMRVISYDGAQYRKQLLSKEERYPVATIIIYYGDKKWGNRSLYENLKISDKKKRYISDYRINVFDLSELSDEEISRFKSDFGIIADYLKHSKVNPEYIPENKMEYKHPYETLDLLSCFTGDEKYRQIYQDENKEEINNMKSSLDYWLEKGREEGREEGLKEGLETGQRTNLLNNIQALMETMDLTKEKAMEVLQVPEDEKEYYLSKI